LDGVFLVAQDNLLLLARHDERWDQAGGEGEKVVFCSLISRLILILLVGRTLVWNNGSLLISSRAPLGTTFFLTNFLMDFEALVERVSTDFAQVDLVLANVSW
jgi:hypothetical protein